MKKLLLILLCLPIIFTSCKKEEVEISNNEYLIFGHFYGECIGEECVETFKLTDEKLYEDLNDNYSGTEPFNFVILGDVFQYSNNYWFNINGHQYFSEQCP